MIDRIRKVTSFAIEVPNRPGEAFKVLSVLVSAGVNLLACHGRTFGRKARIDVVPGDSAAFIAAVTHAGLKFTSLESGFYIHGSDRPGALAAHLEKLASGGVNLTHIDSLSAGQDQWSAIMWVTTQDLEAAAQLLGVRL